MKEVQHAGHEPLAMMHPGASPPGPRSLFLLLLSVSASVSVSLFLSPASGGPCRNNMWAYGMRQATSSGTIFFESLGSSPNLNPDGWPWPETTDGVHLLAHTPCPVI
ncbi:hypothetical protein LZ31DRAFT_149188 [Colletotrichum somersetense]|nr:hypothetical protein LZ31DRAFT_149188 [Colletotrichum somersetense]